MKSLFMFVMLILYSVANMSYGSVKSKPELKKNKKFLHESRINNMEHSIITSFKDFINATSIEPFAKYAWDADNGVASILTRAPVRGMLPKDTTFVNEKIRSDVQVKVSISQNILLFSANFSIMLLDSSGSLFVNIALPAPQYTYEMREIADFISDHEHNLYILERVKVKNQISNRLIKINNKGEIVWEKEDVYCSDKFDLSTLTGNNIGFLFDTENIFLYGAHNRCMIIAQIEKESGVLRPYHTLNIDTRFLFMDDRGMIYYTRYIQEKKMMYWIKYDPDTKTEISFSGNKDMYGLLKIPIAGDNYGRGYGKFGMEIGCIDNSNNTIWKAELDNIVIDIATMTLYLSKIFKTESDIGVVVEKRKNKTNNHKESTVLSIPPDLIKKDNIVSCRLVRVKGESFYVRCDLISGRRLLLFFKGSGELVEKKQLSLGLNDLSDFPTKYDFKLQPPNSWGFDREGNIYLPIHGPEYLYIYKVSFGKQEI